MKNIHKIDIITIGKIKDEYQTVAIAEYKKRLTPFCKLNIIELAESRLPKAASQQEIIKALEKESDSIFTCIPPKSYVIALCIEGKQLSSNEFADTIEKCALNGQSNIVFVIGSSYGLHKNIKQKADMQLSFSRMTFTHTMARILILEQIYRAYKINHGGTYHK